MYPKDELLNINQHDRNYLKWQEPSLGNIYLSFSFMNLTHVAAATAFEALSCCPSSYTAIRAGASWAATACKYITREESENHGLL